MAGFRIFRRLRELVDVDTSGAAVGDALVLDTDGETWVPGAGGGGGAPDDAGYLVTAAHAGLSAEVAVGATPGGELGGTWAAPTVDASHAGGTHAAVQAAAEATAAAALAAHAAAGDPHPGYTTAAELAAFAQPLDSDLTAIAALTTTAFGRALLELANQAALLSAAGAAAASHAHAGEDVTSGTVADARIASTIARDSEVTAAIAAALAAADGAGLSDNGSGVLAVNVDGSTIEISGDALRVVAGVFAAASHAHAGEDVTSGTVADARIASTIARDSEVAAAYQPLDADLTAVAALTTTAFGRGLLELANAAAARALLDLEAGTDFPSLATFNDHSARHEDGGGDEISIAGLSGIPAELQTHLDDTTAHLAVRIPFTPAGTISATDVQTAIEEVAAEAGGGGAPTGADYLVGTAHGGLSAEIVVGTSPGGELGGTWASPTVDATHSGSSHAGVQSAAEATAQAALDAHTGDTTDAHDASAISVADAGAILVAANVEAALAEILGQMLDGWISDAATWTRTADTTFTVSGDRTAVFTKGTRIKVTDTTTKYFVVVGASHAAGTTTVTITGGTDYVLAANPSARWFSYAANPQGYPTWFNYTPANEVGWSDANPWLAARFCVVGSACTLEIYGEGTSNSTSTSFDAPIARAAAAGTSMLYLCQIRNNGTFAAGRYFFNSATNIIANASVTGAAWTASGTKTVSLLVTYPI